MDIATNSPHGISNKDAERFWNKIEVGPADVCWDWQAAKDKDGYGVFKLNGTKWRAHRVAALLDGRNPTGKVVRHTCDNPGCVNPNHLIVDTQRENMADMVRRDRQPKGVKNGSSKLTPEQVRAIRASDRPSTELAPEHGVSSGTIRTVRTRRTWRHVA